MSKKKPAPRVEYHNRTITISVCMPVSVTMDVRAPKIIDGEDRALEPGDVDWEIVGIRRTNAEATPRSVSECMREDDFVELDRVACEAQDRE